MASELSRFRFLLQWRSVALLVTLASTFLHTAAPQSAKRTSYAALPEAPQPQTPSSSDLPNPQPCASPSASKNLPATTQPRNTAATEAAPYGSTSVSHAPCVSARKNWYQRFADGPHDKPLTPMDKGWLAARNVADPFNVITILGEAGISVAADPDSPYGPGMPGYGRYVGVSFTQDMTGEFFGTFLIPSITHQDPHYHRLAHASILRRAAHACLQVVWTQGDSGKDMPNYANIFGFAADDEISDLYVPGRATNLHASAERYGTAFATAPIGNFVSEFLPDVAKRIHVQVVIIQRIINHVASNGSGSQ